jgi:hypothetical protein
MEEFNELSSDIHADRDATEPVSSALFKSVFTEIAKVSKCIYSA